MLSFKDAYTLWRWLPFPRCGNDEGLILAHDDLALADEYVATVARFVERGIYKQAPVDVLEMLEEIMLRIETLGDKVSSEEQVTAHRLHAYAALLYFVYSEFLSMDPSGS